MHNKEELTIVNGKGELSATCDKVLATINPLMQRMHTDYPTEFTGDSVMARLSNSVVSAPVVPMRSKMRRTQIDGKLLSTHVGLAPSRSKEGIAAIYCLVLRAPLERDPGRRALCYLLIIPCLRGQRGNSVTVSYTDRTPVYRALPDCSLAISPSFHRA